MYKRHGDFRLKVKRLRRDVDIAVAEAKLKETDDRLAAMEACCADCAAKISMNHSSSKVPSALCPL